MIMNKTLKELLTDPLIKDIAPDAISKWDLSKEEFYNWTLREISDKMGWKVLKSGFETLFKNAGRGNYYYKLYSKDEYGKHPGADNANFVYFPSDDEKAKERPFIMLIPGGGFVNVWNMTEGWPIARIYNELGYNVVILTYRVGIEGTAVEAMEDMARAFEIIRKNKELFNLDPDKYITCGFSAGGYIVCLWNTEKGYAAFNLSKPEACIPVYPATSYRIMGDADWESGRELDEFTRVGVGVTYEEACNSCFEIPLHVEGFPMTALFATAEDTMVNPDHSRNLARALDDAGILCRLEIGPTGGHGFADGAGMCMEGWPKRAIDWYESNKQTI